MKKEKVSVIINCLNGSKFLNTCLKSVLKQTYKNLEIIFWDNNSIDQSLNLIKKIKDKRIKIFRSSKTLKLYDARNHAIKKSTGKFLAFIDIDDTWSKLKVEKQLKKIKKENSDIIYNNHWIVKNHSNHWLDRSGKTLYSKNKLPFLNMSYEILNNYPITISTVMVKRKVFFELGGFNKTFEIIGDFDLFFKISTRYKFSVIQEPLATYLSHPENTSKTKFKLRIIEMYKWLKINKKKHKFKDYHHLFNKIYINNKYLELSYYIINKNYKLFFKNLNDLKNATLYFKLIFKLFYYIIFIK